MKIEISSVSEKGNLEKERLVLTVKADTDIGEYALIQTDFDGEEVLTKVHQALWFPYKPVTEDDFVIIYTKPGQPNTKELEDGRATHFYYWGLPEPIWNVEDRIPVLLHAPKWTYKDPKEL